MYRSMLKQTEMECKYLKRWFGSPTEQNRRLREVEELRAMKHARSLYKKPMPDISAMELLDVMKIQDVAQNIQSYAPKDHLLIITTEDARPWIVAAAAQRKRCSDDHPYLGTVGVR
ncbi:hypothetical protein Q3G72_021485 [Acer saccharum]|nr:hypothetical protein Q3G72_021485 [Acer saccharum]